MRAVRGRAGDIEEDRAVTRSLLEDARETGIPAVRAWTPHRQVAFGRRDAREAGYDRAREAAREHGFPPYEREVGGRAVAYTGSTVAFVRVDPDAELRAGIDDRYNTAIRDVRDALAAVGVDVTKGEPARSFCPGTHSLSVHGRKVAGLAQRVARGAAQVAGIVIVRDHTRIATVLEDVYDALDVPFDSDTVGSVARGGGNATPRAITRALEDALAGGKREVEYLD